MNNLLLGGGALAGILFLLYRFGLNFLINSTIQQTAKEDKSLEQQQLENQAKLAQVNRDLDGLYDERKKLRDEYVADAQKTDQQKADEWNKK